MPVKCEGDFTKIVDSNGRCKTVIIWTIGKPIDFAYIDKTLSIELIIDSKREIAVEFDLEAKNNKLGGDFMEREGRNNQEDREISIWEGEGGASLESGGQSVRKLSTAKDVSESIVVIPDPLDPRSFRVRDSALDVAPMDDKDLEDERIALLENTTHMGD